MADLTQDRIRQIYDDFVHCRLDRLSEAFHPNVDFISHAPADLFPYLGHRIAATPAAKEAGGDQLADDVDLRMPRLPCYRQESLALFK